MRDGSLEKCIGRYGKNMYVLYIYCLTLKAMFCCSSWQLLAALWPTEEGNSELIPQYKHFDFTIFYTYAVADQDHNIFW